MDTACIRPGKGKTLAEQLEKRTASDINPNPKTCLYTKNTNEIRQVPLRLPKNERRNAHTLDSKHDETVLAQFQKFICPRLFETF
jgi:hypothetical protein